MSFGFSSAKVLVYLYGMSLVSKLGVPDEDLYLLLPDLSKSGVRSLIYQLEKKQFITTQKVDSQKLLHITSHGKVAIEARFPALPDRLKTWKGGWAVLIFLSSPASDPQFRYLRQLLVDNNVAQLTRGVYVYPSQFPRDVRQQFQHYRGAITVAEASSWQFGDERSLITELFSLSDVVQNLSGVSKEVSHLLAIYDKDKSAMQQRRDVVFLVFDRLMNILESDVGIHHAYFPQVEGSRELLKSCCELLLL